MQTLKVPTLPLLRPWYTLATGDDGQLILHYADSAIVMPASAVTAFVRELLPLLDGTRTVDEIIAATGGGRAGAVRRVVQQLNDAGVLLDGPPLPPDVAPHIASSLHYLAATMPAADPLEYDLTKLRLLDIGIVGSAPAAAHVAATLLQNEVGRVTALTFAEILRAEAAELPAFIVAAPAPSELVHLDAWNSIAILRRTPWLQVLPFDGRFAALGPVYVPGETACHRCFMLRREGNAGYGDEFAAVHRTPAKYPTTAALELAIAGLAGLVLLRWLMRADAWLPGRFYALETGGDITLTAHHVYRVPRCPSCSAASATAAPSPWFDAVG